MPFALLFIGLMLVIVAVRNTQDQFVTTVKGDFTGRGNFFYWVVALVAIGAIGYVEKLKPLADGLLVLILAALVLTRGSPSFPGGGVFQQFVAALKGTTVAAPNTVSGATLGALGSGSGTVNTPGLTVGIPGVGTVSAPGRTVTIY